MSKPHVTNRVEKIRKSRGIGSSDLARRVNVSRQTIYAIESGAYVPNTEVALRIARELEVTIDDLFALTAPEPPNANLLRTELLSADPPAAGQAVRICRVGSEWVGVPVTAAPYYMPEADGIVSLTHAGQQQSDLTVFAKDEAEQKRLVLAGCDPATGLLSHTVEKASGVEVVAAGASSQLALRWLKEGKVHIAGSHLEDPASGEFNLPYLRKEFAGEDLLVVVFAEWEEGFVVAPGNPKNIRGVADLAQPNVRLINREQGSGSRALLDKLLQSNDIPSAGIPGYQHAAPGHLAAAYAVMSGDADVCLATRSAAQTFSLDFVPLHRARYDLVLRKQSAELAPVKALLDVLQRTTLRRKLEVLAGYDTARTGSQIV